jgi:hypothetical protein
VGLQDLDRIRFLRVNGRVAKRLDARGIHGKGDCKILQPPAAFRTTRGYRFKTEKSAKER